MGLKFGEEKVIFGPKTKKRIIWVKIWGEKIILVQKTKKNPKLRGRKPY